MEDAAMRIYITKMQTVAGFEVEESRFFEQFSWTVQDTDSLSMSKALQ